MDETGPIRRAAGVACLLAFAGALGPCGRGTRPRSPWLAGGGEAGGLRIERAILPPGRAGRPYGPVHLRAAGADPRQVAWHLGEGALPPGLVLRPDGTLEGVPRRPGAATFVVQACDGTHDARATLAVAVDDLALWAASGLECGEAWAGRPVELAVAGAHGRVDFQIVAAPSGGRLVCSPGDPAHAVWWPGARGGALCRDVLAVVDEVTRRRRVLRLPVRPDPTATFRAGFGSTDVWYVDDRVKRGRHDYVSDFHAALAALGLRDPGSTGAHGSTADRLAALWVRLEILRRLRDLYRDGHRALAISFPFDEPGPDASKPAPARSAAAEPHAFNQIALLDGGDRDVVGTALVDGPSNALMENDTSAGTQALGVFLDVLVPYVRREHPSSLTETPVGAADVPALRALLHGLPCAGGRTDLIRREGAAFADVVAVVLAHEIGHSLGLPHTEPARGDSLMNAQAPVQPGVRPAFLPRDLARLRAALPGRGRGPGVVPARAPFAAPAASACARRACDLRLPPVRPWRRPPAGPARAPRCGPPGR
jgi:hypothetical protein